MIVTLGSISNLEFFNRVATVPIDSWNALGIDLEVLYGRR